jgi:hypothetical protein
MAKPSKEQEQIETMKPWIDMMQAKAFLAGDFLLWLWYFAESKDNPVELSLASRGGKLLTKIWIEDRLVLESLDSKAHSHTLKGGEPSRSSEAESALRSGKAVKELRLGMHIDPYGDFLVLLSSKDLSPKSVILPGKDSEGSRLSLAYRLQMTDIMVEALDALFSIFLDVRTGDGWRKTKLPAIQDWIKSRGHAETHLH